MAIARVQTAQRRATRLFVDEDVQIMQRKEIELINIDEPSGRKRWEALNNDPDVYVYSEKDVTGRSMAILRYMRKTPMRDVEVSSAPAREDLWPEGV